MFGETGAASSLGDMGGDVGVMIDVGTVGEVGVVEGVLDRIPKSDPSRCLSLEVVDPGLDLLIAAAMLSLVGEASAIADVGERGADSAR